jgi:protein-glucosylgalactosylhydroxylysine glucosidase
MADAAFFYLMSSTRYRANRLGRIADPTSAKIAEKIVIPMREQVIVSHDGYRSNEEKGATPDPLMGVFPLAFEMTSEIEAATLKFYLGRSEEVSGQSHALSAVRSLGGLCGRLCSVRKANGGRVGRFCVGRFCQTLEYRADVFPQLPVQALSSRTSPAS